MRKWLNEFRRRSLGTRKAEKRLMDEFADGRRIPGSGSQPISKGWSAHIVASQAFGSTRNRTAGGDGYSDLFLVEHKRTELLKFSVTREILEIIEDHAERANKLPLLVISFLNPNVVKMNARYTPYLEWGVMRLADFDTLVRAGIVYIPAHYTAPGKSFGWTNRRVQEVLNAIEETEDLMPSVHIHFTPEGSEDPEDDVERGNDDTWVILPFKEVTMMEREALV